MNQILLGLFLAFIIGYIIGYMGGERGGSGKILHILKTSTKEEIEALLSKKPPRRIWRRIQ